MDLPRLETPRLRLRPLRLSDTGWLRELATDADVRRTTLQPVLGPWIGVLSAFVQASGEESGVAIEERSSGVPAGWIRVDGLEPAPYPAVGFEIRRRFWNRGFATEALRAVTGHLLGDAGQIAISGLVFVEHRACQRVFEKTGFRRIEECDCFGHACLEYEFLAETWRRGNPAT